MTDYIKYRALPDVKRFYGFGATMMVTECASRHTFKSDCVIQRFYCITEPKDEEAALEARIAGAVVFGAPLVTLYQAFGARQLPAADVVEEGLHVCLARQAVNGVLERDTSSAMDDLRAIADATKGGLLKVPVKLSKGDALELRLIGSAPPLVTIVVFGIAMEPAA